MERKKKDADFQDEYHKSSNFSKLNQDEKLKIKGDGKLKMKNDAEMKTESEEQKIKEALKTIGNEEE